MKKLLILILLAVIVGVVGLMVVFSQSSKGKTYIVELRQEGFVPNTIRLKKGDIIEFRTTRKENFWPASNLHPTHGIFPDFDPKRALLPNETWSFQFNKTGQWGFHDHITPEYTGKITVTK